MTLKEIIEELKNLEFYNRLFDNSETVDRKTEAVVGAIKGLEELKRHREAWMNVVSEVDQHTEIHSDGEFYIKNFDVKKIIAEYRPKEADTV